MKVKSYLVGPIDKPNATVIISAESMSALLKLVVGANFFSPPHGSSLPVAIRFVPPLPPPSPATSVDKLNGVCCCNFCHNQGVTIDELKMAILCEGRLSVKVFQLGHMN